MMGYANHRFALVFSFAAAVGVVLLRVAIG
jgi:hypothetical protein